MRQSSETVACTVEDLQCQPEIVDQSDQDPNPSSKNFLRKFYEFRKQSSIHLLFFWYHRNFCPRHSIKGKNFYDANQSISKANFLVLI